MIHVFLLMVYLGTGEDRRAVSKDMYFYSVVDCNFFANEVSKRFGNYGSIESMNSKDRITAYCLPKYINKDTKNIKIY
jgi:hypothetical protein